MGWNIWRGLISSFLFERSSFTQNYFKTILDIYPKMWYYIYKIRDNKKTRSDFYEHSNYNWKFNKKLGN